MPPKRAKPAAASDDIDELFEGIGGVDGAGPKKQPAKTTKPAGAAKGNAEPEQEDFLAELENELGEKQPERPHTPRLGSGAAAAKKRTPPPSERAASEDKDSKARGSAGAAANAASFTPPSATAAELQDSEVVEQQQRQQAAAGASWWGGWGSNILSTASAAMKQAEAAVSQIQQNEEAKKWADQVRVNAGVLRGFSDDLRHRAMPTFTNILHTLAPPISSHERLLIHITHDLVGYPSMDPLVHGIFSRVMAQVEGGDLLVIQRGQENTIRSPGTAEKQHLLFTGGQSSAGWRDGPWWRAVDAPRDLGLVKGLTEGTKLCRASAEAYAADFFAASGGVEAARRRALEPVSESNPVRRSDLFLAVQALAVDADKALFAASAADAQEKADSAVAEEDEADEQVCFAVFIYDPVHEIQYHTVSQAMPARWVRWLDAPAVLTPASSSAEDGQGGDHTRQQQQEQQQQHHPLDPLERVPDEIREIVESGGVDPREWVAEWMEETLSLASGVVAQRYVARRMGVGEGGLGKGKRKMEAVVQEGGGEAARAGLI